MKTLQELYGEVLKNAEWKEAFAEAVRNKTVEDFLKAHGCEASAGDLEAFLKEQPSGELADDELDGVSGGCDGDEAALSVFSLGLGCAAKAIESARFADEMPKQGGQILCGENQDERGRHL